MLPPPLSAAPAGADAGTSSEEEEADPGPDLTAMVKLRKGLLATAVQLSAPAGDVAKLQEDLRVAEVSLAATRPPERRYRSAVDRRDGLALRLAAGTKAVTAAQEELRKLSSDLASVAELHASAEEECRELLLLQTHAAPTAEAGPNAQVQALARQSVDLFRILAAHLPGLNEEAKAAMEAAASQWQAVCEPAPASVIPLPKAAAPERAMGPDSTRKAPATPRADAAGLAEGSTATGSQETALALVPAASGGCQGLGREVQQTCEGPVLQGVSTKRRCSGVLDPQQAASEALFVSQGMLNTQDWRAKPGEEDSAEAERAKAGMDLDEQIPCPAQ